MLVLNMSGQTNGKAKTRKSAAKRFKIKGSSIKRGTANRRHLLTGKSPKLKRQLRSPASQVADADVKRVKQMLAQA